MNEMIKLVEVIEVLSSSDKDKTIFMKQGKGGKVVHLSSGATRENNLLCGVTYSRGSGRGSYLFSLTGYNEMPVSAMCKNCMESIEWHKNSKVSK